jgi:hypothetical protein
VRIKNTYEKPGWSDVDIYPPHTPFTQTILFPHTSLGAENFTNSVDMFVLLAAQKHHEEWMSLSALGFESTG